MIEGQTIPCPTAESIRHYAAGGFDDQHAEQLENHLLSCPHCETLLDGLDDPSDAIIQALATLPMSAEDEAVYQQLRESALANPVKFANSAEASAQLQLASRLADPDLGPLPCQLGSYELLTCIGRGASGAVYRARHLKLDQTVAVKVLDSSRTIDPESFLQEMKTIGSLTHPNIVRATDAGEADGQHFLVMEYVDGIDAARLLFRHGPLRVPDACEIIRQAALGLQFIHEQSLIHRDVKPSNLLVTVDARVKLLDLGIATRSGDQPTESGPARPQGTYDYMAPEAWDNPEAIDSRSDLYSLGCALHKLIAACVPAKDGDLDSAALSHIPRSLQRLLQSLLAKNPQQRPNSMQEVIKTLNPLCRTADLRALIAKTSPQLAELVQSGHPRKAGTLRNLLDRRTALIAAATLGGAALFSQRLPFFSSPTLKRSAWRSLEPVEPKIILALGDATTASIDTAQQGELAVTADDLTLVNMGRPLNGLFSISVDMTPNDSPNCGVFFQGQYDYSQPNRIFQFQSVELVRVRGQQKAESGYYLLWSQRTSERVADTFDTVHTPLAEVGIQLAGEELAQNLRVSCGRQGMPEVLWNGEPVHESMWRLSAEGHALQRLSTGLLPTAYLGRIGLCSTRGTTVFRRPRLSYL